MPVVKNGTVLYVQHPKDHIEPGVHLKYVEETIDLDKVPLDGGVLVKTLALSSDPYIRYRLRDPSIPMFCPPVLIGTPVDNMGIGKVIRSDDPEFKPGDYVGGYLDYSEYSIYPGKNVHFFKNPLRKIEKHPDIPWSVFTGALGLAGMTAYSGLKIFAAEKLKTSKVMFVSNAGGGVGLFVIEYAKILAPHLKIIASAGTQEKLRFMKESGADVVFNYKTADTLGVLREHGPIDVYWDNVGGYALDAALETINDFGLIVACGAISQATGQESPVMKWDHVFKRSLTVHGYICFTGPSAAALPTFFDDIVPLIVQKKISTREHHYHGLKEAAKSLRDVHTGENTGKAVILVADD